MRPQSNDLGDTALPLTACVGNYVGLVIVRFFCVSSHARDNTPIFVFRIYEYFDVLYMYSDCVYVYLVWL